MDFKRIKADTQAKAKSLYRQLNSVSGGALYILVHSFQSFSEARAAEAAASLAYYALFSIFPLLIFLVGSVTTYLEDPSIQGFVLDFIERTLPDYFQELVEGNIERALSLRGQVQIVGTIGLLWAASAVFTVLTQNIDRAWQIPEKRSFILGRLAGLGMIASLTTGLIILWILSTALLNILPLLEIPLWGGRSIQIYDTYLWSTLARGIPWVVIFFAFVNLYRWVPNTTVHWSEAAWGAAIAAVGWELAQRGFGWYLTSGFARYQLVYGSLGAVIAFMLWLYVSGLIVLYGAHLSAAVAAQHRPEDRNNE